MAQSTNGGAWERDFIRSMARQGGSAAKPSKRPAAKPSAKPDLITTRPGIALSFVCQIARNRSALTPRLSGVVGPLHP
jgi:Holliday junction resolvase